LTQDLVDSDRAVAASQQELDTAITTLNDEINRCTNEAANNAQRLVDLEDERSLIEQLEELFNDRIKTIKGSVKKRAKEHMATGEFKDSSMKERVVKKNDRLKAKDYTPY
jgi:uncharacterized spore protein YtfJ